MNYFGRRLALIFFSLPILIPLALFSEPVAPVNIALHKKVTFSKAPNYQYSAKPGLVEITDGKYAGDDLDGTSKQSLWVRKGSVGWQHVAPLAITIDLGEIQPISGVSYSTAAGRAEVTWPSMIWIAVSDDQKNWRFAGDLIELSRKNGKTPPEEAYANHRYVTHELHTKGRYISFGVLVNRFAFVDEIEVYRGDDAWLVEEPSGEIIEDIGTYITHHQEASRARQRMNKDIDAVRTHVQGSTVAAAQKDSFLARLDKASVAVGKVRKLPDDFKAILPLNATHREVFAVYGELRAAEGRKSLTWWKEHRYNWLSLLPEPHTKNPLELSFSMLGNQIRADSFLITNAGGEERKVMLHLKDAPAGAQPGWLVVNSVEWTDTAQGIPVADALIPVPEQDGRYQISVPAGMTRKVWVSVDSSKIPAGSYQCTLAAGEITIPVSVSVSRIAMNRPRFSLGMWDYAGGPAGRGITSKNLDVALKMMKSYYVDSPWATGAVLPVPGDKDFDTQGKLAAKLDFSALDAWVKMWPEARRYFVYLSKSPTNRNFKGAEMGTPEFDAKLGSWAQAIAEHVKALGLKPSQLCLLIVDEPHSDAEDEVSAAWAKAIKAAAPELTLFSDPTWERPDQAKVQEAYTQMNILCPGPVRYFKGGKPVADYFQSLPGELWFYQCAGPVRLFQPQQYYRYQPWLGFKEGATGQGFWSFGDISQAHTSWNEYPATRSTFAPPFIDTDTIYSSIHWEAVREGMQDNETLAMLQDWIEVSKAIEDHESWKKSAQKVLDQAVAAVTNDWSADKYKWHKTENYDIADQQLILVQQKLAEARAPRD